MRYFLALLCFTATLCSAQQAYTHSSKPDTAVSTDESDEKNQNFLLIFDIGIGIPENEYGAPPANYSNSSLNPEAVYGYSQPGPHLDITGIYLPVVNFGFAARFGMDIDNKVYQYLGGFYISVKPIQSDFNIYFLGLLGEVTADVTTGPSTSYGPAIGIINYPTGGSEQPGNGSGFGYFIGTGLLSKYNSFYFSFSVGYLHSDINFPNGTTTTYFNAGPNQAAYSPMLMSLGILQVNLGATYNF